MKRTVVIVDDHGLFREGLQALLSRDVNLAVVGQGATSEDALALVAEHTPDVLLLDVEIPGTPAATTVRTLRRNHPRTAIVILTMHADRILAGQLADAGAQHYLVKTTSSANLLKVVRTAIASPELAQELSRAHCHGGQILSHRELEVLRMVSLAYSNKEIGRQLSLVEGTVKRHVSNIFAKLDATCRMDAVRRAANLGLLNSRVAEVSTLGHDRLPAARMERQAGATERGDQRKPA